MDQSMPQGQGYTFFWSHMPTKYPQGCKHYVFSQWWKSTFTEPGAKPRIYSSAEQYMMAKKAHLFEDWDVLRQIMACDSPKAIKGLGRQVKNFQAGQWELHAYDYVVQANRLKFSQDPELRDVLLGTGNTLLVEASPTDSIWGIGLAEADAVDLPAEQWPGTNLLGKALTHVREELKLELEQGAAGASAAPSSAT